MNDVIETLFYIVMLTAFCIFFYSKCFPQNNRINMSNLSEDIEKMYKAKTDLYTLENLLVDIESCSMGKRTKVLSLTWVDEHHDGEIVTYEFTVHDKKDYIAEAFKYLIGNESEGIKAELKNDTKYLKHRSERNLIVPSKYDRKVAKYLYNNSTTPLHKKEQN